MNFEWNRALVFKKLLKPKHGHVSMLSRGRYDGLGHFWNAKKQRVTGPERNTVFYRGQPDAALSSLLSADAAQAMKAGPYSVYDKNDSAPSGDKGDYFSAAPYFWPNPDTADGLPYVRRDCDRIPNTELYSEASKDYDRTSFQLMLDGVIALTFSGGEQEHRRAADYIRHWFLNPASAMNPNMNFAQVRRGLGRNRGAASGLIEIRDMALLIDCIRVLEESGTFEGSEIVQLKNWFRNLLQWFQVAPQALNERRSGNNHGTMYDLLNLSLSLFVGDKNRMQSHVARALARLPEQFAENGDQPEESKRPHVLHYCTYNLQSWLLLSRALEAAGVTMLLPVKTYFEPATRHLWNRYLEDPAQAGKEQFETRRLVPLFKDIKERTAASWLSEALQHADLQNVPEVFHPFTGVPPYWRLLFEGAERGDDEG